MWGFYFLWIAFRSFLEEFVEDLDLLLIVFFLLADCSGRWGLSAHALEKRWADFLVLVQPLEDDWDTGLDVGPGSGVSVLFLEPHELSGIWIATEDSH